MASPTLLADALLALLTAGVFAYAGELMRKRHVESPDGQRAMRRFAIWWYGLAVYTALGALRGALAALGNLDVQTHVVLNGASVVPLVALLWGLVSYLAYIYTGSRRALTVVTAVHLAIFAFYAWLVWSLRPTGVRAEAWSAPIDYEGGLSPGVTAAILATMLLPTLAAAIGYASLYVRTDDPSARYRIATTSGAFLLWFGSAGIAAITSLASWYWWPLAARVIGLVATLLVLAAYRPPSWLRARFGLEATGTDETHRPRTGFRVAVA